VTARPWRAAAYVPGQPRYYWGHASARTREGLSASVSRWTALGLVVEVWEVLRLPGVTQGTQTTDSPTG
jgi:hypothetical protein